MSPAAWPKYKPEEWDTLKLTKGITAVLDPAQGVDFDLLFLHDVYFDTPGSFLVNRYTGELFRGYADGELQIVTTPAFGEVIKRRCHTYWVLVHEGSQGPGLFFRLA